MLGALFDFALDFSVAGSESFVEDVIPFVLAVSFSNLVEYRSGSADGVEDLIVASLFSAELSERSARLWLS
jgi:hypothetical protein